MFADGFDLHGCFDGYVITYLGREVVIIPSSHGAYQSLKAARWANAELARVLAETSSQKEA